MRFGYACINTTLNDNVKKENRITTNRTMRKKTFLEKGLPYVSELVLKNVTDLSKILEWNKDNGIHFFRISSDMIPWASEYDLEDLPNFPEIKNALSKAGQFAIDNDMRLTFHPGPFNKLASEKAGVVQNTILELSTHGEIFDLMGLSRTHYNKINIHVGMKRSQDAIDRFIDSFRYLPESVKTRLTLENDDKESMFHVRSLVSIYEKIGVPIVFDYHHHKFCHDGQSEEEALKMAVNTWGSITPVVHYSESKKESSKPQAHSVMVTNSFNDYGLNFDVMLEAKGKEKALLAWKAFKPYT